MNSNIANQNKLTNLQKLLLDKDQNMQEQSLNQEILEKQPIPPEIKEKSEEITHLFETINNAQNLGEKKERVKNSVFFEEFKNIDSSPEFNQEQIKKLDEINEKLQINPQLTEKIINRLLDIQANLLSDRNNEAIKPVEIGHIKQVVELCQRHYPDNIIMAIAAAVHDSYKFTNNNKMELGMHELASTYFSGFLLDTVFKEFKQELAEDLEENDISLIKTAVKRAVFTHGFKEYPYNNSKKDPNYPELNTLFGVQVYPVPQEKTSIVDVNQNNIYTESIAGLNAMDMIVGSMALSYVKYNNTFDKSKFNSPDYPDFASYVEKYIFNSFEGNVNSDALKYLLQINNDSEKPLPKFIEKLTFFRDLTVMLMSNIDSIDKLSSNVAIKLNNENKHADENYKIVVKFNKIKDLSSGLSETYKKIQNDPTNETFIKDFNYKFKELFLELEEVIDTLYK